MPTKAMVPSCARQPSGRRAAAAPERYVPQQKLNSQRDADIGPTPAQRGVRGGVKSPAPKDGAKQLRLGTGYANSLPAADGYHEPHKLDARQPKQPVLAVPIATVGAKLPARVLDVISQRRGDTELRGRPDPLTPLEFKALDAVAELSAKLLGVYCVSVASLLRRLQVGVHSLDVRV